MHAVGRRAIDAEHAIRLLAHAQREIERQGITGAAAIAIRRNHGNVRDCGQLARQRTQTTRAVPIVVTDQNLQKVLSCVPAVDRAVTAHAARAATERQRLALDRHQGVTILE